MYTIKPCKKCVCQTCYDIYHQCKHKRNPTTLPKKLGEHDCRSSLYMDDYIEFPYKPPVATFRPIRRDPLRTGNYATEKTLYQRNFAAPQMPEKDVYCPKLRKHRPRTPEMEKQSVYMKDYSINLHPSFRDEMLKAMDIALKLDEKENNKDRVLSFPKRPPRPYDYSKCEDELTGVVYIPRMLRKHRRPNDEVPVKLPTYHSDGSPSSYFGGTVTKMAYRAGLDSLHMPCCRPEQPYHPERFQKCLDAQPKENKKQCSECIYVPADKPVWATNESFIGVKSTFSDETTYQHTFRDHFCEAVPNPRVGDRDYDPKLEPVLQMSRYLPMGPGFQSCKEVQG